MDKRPEPEEQAENIPPEAKTSKLKFQSSGVKQHFREDNGTLLKTCVCSTPAPSESKSRLSGVLSTLSPILKYLNIENKQSPPQSVKCASSSSCLKSTGKSAHHSSFNFSAMHSGTLLGATHQPYCLLDFECLPEMTLLDDTNNATMELTKTDSGYPQSAPLAPNPNGVMCGQESNANSPACPPQPPGTQKHKTVKPSEMQSSSAWNRLLDGNLPEITLLDISSDSEMLPGVQTTFKGEMLELTQDMMEDMKEDLAQNITHDVEQDKMKGMVQDMAQDLPVDVTHDKIQHKTQDMVQDMELDMVMDKRQDLAQNKTKDLLEDKTRDTVQDIELDMVQDKTQDVLQDKTQDVLQDKTQDVLQDKTQDVLQDKTQDLVLDKTQDVLQDKTQDLDQDIKLEMVQDKTQDLVQDKTQDKTQDLVQDKTEDLVQNKTQDMVQDLPLNKTQDMTQDLVQGKTQDLMQDKTQDLVQNKTQDLVQDKTQDVLQDKTQDVLQDKTQDVLQDKTHDLMQDKTLDVLQDKTHDLVQDKTQDVLQDKVQDKTHDLVQDKTQDVLQDKAQDLVQDKTQDLVQDKTQDVLQDKTQDLSLNKTQELAQDKTQDVGQEKTLDVVQNTELDVLQDKTKDTVQDKERDIVWNLTQDKKQDVVEGIELDIVQDKTQDLVQDVLQNRNDDVSENLHPELPEHNGTPDSAEKKSKMVENPEGTFETPPALELLSGGDGCQREDRSQPVLHMSMELSDSSIISSMDTNKSNTLVLDKTLDSVPDPKFSSTPMIDLKMFNFKTFRDEGQVLAAQKKLYQDGLSKPADQVPSEIPSNIVADRKTFLPQTGSKLLWPLSKASSQLPKISNSGVKSTIPRKQESLQSNLPMKRQRIQDSVRKPVPPEGPQGITDEQSSSSLCTRTAVFKLPASGLQRPQVSKMTKPAATVRKLPARVNSQVLATADKPCGSKDAVKQLSSTEANSRTLKQPAVRQRSFLTKPQRQGCANCSVLEEQLKRKTEELEKIQEELLKYTKKSRK
ncbi:hypothetical protein OJAV_G00189730 [Oryzias javanicus]|uniref:Uncharacterized protein n=1 Tax=Oryzias javanicus TaxID=123683 RepID=A0A3S2NYE0_ORYJA|nr:hypothetical protein OJAV_G00189730 [Oryzias javanicus]